jgi:hypothetical protein
VGLVVLCLTAVAASDASVTSPAKPGGLVARSLSPTSLRLSWTGSNPRARVAGYRVYVDDKLLASVRSTSYLVRRLDCGTRYAVAVTAYDRAGHGSARRAGTAKTLRCGSTPSAGASASAAPNPQDSCTRTIDAGVSLQSAVGAAAPGSVICLGGGDYGDVTIQNVDGVGTVVVRPAPDASASLRLTLIESHHLRFTGLTVAGLLLRSDTDITFSHNTFTGMTVVETELANASVLFDANRLDGINAGPNDFEGRITVRGFDNKAPVGVTIRNNHFGGGCSDGVQVVGSAYGVKIGPGNEFTGIKQLGCDPVHADPIQLYGAVATIVTGNWFHDNGNGTGGLASFAGDSPATVTNNVFVCTCIYPHSVGAWGARGWLVAHNTFIGGVLRFQRTDDGKVPSGNEVRDNVWLGGGISTDTPDWGTDDHNLNAGIRGDGNLRGRPRFVGGPDPKTYAGYRLAPGSPGAGRASDGSDMGIRGSH